MIPTTNPWRLIDFAAATHEPKVVLIILVADQFLVEITDALKNAFVPAAVNYGIHIAFILRVMRTRSANCERRMKCRLNRPFLIGRRGSAHRPAYIVSSSFTQHNKALLDIIRRVNRMSVHANNDFTPSFAQGRVQSGGDNSSGVTEKAH